MHDRGMLNTIHCQARHMANGVGILFKRACKLDGTGLDTVCSARAGRRILYDREVSGHKGWPRGSETS